MLLWPDLPLRIMGNIIGQTPYIDSRYQTRIIPANHFAADTHIRLHIEHSFPVLFLGRIVNFLLKCCLLSCCYLCCPIAAMGWCALRRHKSLPRVRTRDRLRGKAPWNEVPRGFPPVDGDIFLIISSRLGIEEFAVNSVRK